MVKRNLKSLIVYLVGLVVLAAGMAVVASPSGHKAKGEKKAMKADIVDTAIAAGSFHTLAKALQEANLVGTLKGKGPFTVFAPTDAAFKKLPPGTLEGLLADKAKLAAVLTYHVVPGKVMAAEAMTLNSAKTMNGQSLTLRSKNGSVTVDNAKVIQADIVASNGVIHVIDNVILPKSN